MKPDFMIPFKKGYMVLGTCTDSGFVGPLISFRSWHNIRYIEFFLVRCKKYGPVMHFSKRWGLPILFVVFWGDKLVWSAFGKEYVTQEEFV